jgi:hypothetical protein
MKVRELIEKLQQQDPDMEVLCDNGETVFRNVPTAVFVELAPDNSSHRVVIEVEH